MPSQRLNAGCDAVALLVSHKITIVTRFWCDRFRWCFFFLAVVLVCSFFFFFFVDGDGRAMCECVCVRAGKSSDRALLYNETCCLSTSTSSTCDLTTNTIT